MLRNDRTKLAKNAFHSSKSNTKDKNDKERSGSKMYERLNLNRLHNTYSYLQSFKGRANILHTDWSKLV